jgi:hypothetical protein
LILNRVQINGTRYYVEGEYPDYEIGVSVTEFIDRVYPTPDNLRDWWIDNSREHIEAKLQRTSLFGTTMHDLAEDFAQGHDIDISKLSSKMQHYLTSIAYFFHDRNVKPIFVERKVFHRATEDIPLSFGGTLDLECMMDWNGKRVRALVDYKSGNIYKKNKWQLLAYMMARQQQEPASSGSCDASHGKFYDSNLEFHLFNFNPNNWRRTPTGKPKHWKITQKDLETFRSFCLIYANEFSNLPNTIRQFDSVSLGNEPQFKQLDLATYIKNQLND